MENSNFQGLTETKKIPAMQPGKILVIPFVGLVYYLNEFACQ